MSKCKIGVVCCGYGGEGAGYTDYESDFVAWCEGVSFVGIVVVLVVGDLGGWSIGVGVGWGG